MEDIVRTDFDEPDSEHLQPKICKVFDDYQKMLDQSFLFATSGDMGDLLRLLPGIAVQRDLTVQGMASLYKVKVNQIERLIISFEGLTLRYSKFGDDPRYVLERYLSRFLRDRDRSQLCYCDPILHHISICRHFLSLLDGSNASSDFQS